MCEFARRRGCEFIATLPARARRREARAPCNKLQRAIVARSSEWRARRRLGAGGAVLERGRAIRCDLQRVVLWQRAFCMDFARFRRARATDWVASRVIHGRTLLCTAVNYADPILRECAVYFWLLCGESTLKTNVKSEGAVTAAVCFRTGLLRPRVRWSRCAHQGRSVGPRRRRRERNGEHPTPIAAAATASRRK